MSIYHSAILDDYEKQILRESLFFYISHIQNNYYNHGTLDAEMYDEQMHVVSSIIDKLHLKNAHGT